MTKLRLVTSISLLFLISCSQPVLKSPIVDSIKQGDTLTLFAEFADCGEWGGHIEKVVLTKKNNDLWVTFYKDSVSCDNDPDVNRKVILEQSQILQSDDRNKIVNYIDKFMLESKREQKPLSNACNYFRIISKDTILEFDDWKMDWKEFRLLRDEMTDANS